MPDEPHRRTADQARARPEDCGPHLREHPVLALGHHPSFRHRGSGREVLLRAPGVPRRLHLRGAGGQRRLPSVPRTGRGRPHAHQGGPRLRREPVGGGREARVRRCHRVRLIGDRHGPARAALGARERLRGRGGGAVPRRRHRCGVGLRRSHAHAQDVAGSRARAGESQERPAGEAAGGRHHAHLSVGGDPRAAPRPHLRRPGVRRRQGARAGRRPHEEGGREPGGKIHARAPL